MTTQSSQSTLPILFIIILAIASLIQFIAPDLLHPGITLLIIGVVFLILYLIHWVREPIAIIVGWVLAGFGLSFWAGELEALSSVSSSLNLFGLGLAFLGIYLTLSPDVAAKIQSRQWPLIPGFLLLLVGAVLVLEGSLGRARFWSIVVPIIPSLVAIWYVVEWRRREEMARK